MAKEYDIGILCDPTKAYLVDGAESSKALVDDRVFKRGWKHIPIRFLESIAKELRDRRSYTNPQTEFKTFAGTWRIQAVEYTKGRDDNDGQIVETLALGFLTAFSAATPDPDVRLYGGVVFPVPNVLELTRVWRYCDPQKADELLVQLQAITSVIDPVADKQTYTGTFKVKKAYSTKSDDGSVDIYQVLQLGLSADFTRSYTPNCKEYVTIVEKEGLSSAELDTALLAYQSSSQGFSGGTYSNGVRNEITIGYNSEDGTYSLSVRQFVAVAWEQAAFTSQASLANTETTERKFNQNTADPIGTVASEGVIVANDVQKNDYCLYDKTEKKDTSILIENPAHTSNINAEGTTVTTEAKNVRSSGANSIANTYAPPTWIAANDTGKTKTQSRSKQDDGTYVVANAVRTHSKQVFEATWSTKDGTGYYKNVADGTDADLANDLATLTTATRNGVSGEKHDCGLNNYRLSKSTSSVGALTPWQDVTWSANTIINGTPTAYTVYIRYFATVNGAQNHMAESPASGRISVGKIDGNNAGIRGPLAGNYIWEATRIELEWS